MRHTLAKNCFKNNICRPPRAANSDNNLPHRIKWKSFLSFETFVFFRSKDIAHLNKIIFSKWKIILQQTPPRKYVFFDSLATLAHIIVPMKFFVPYRPHSDFFGCSRVLGKEKLCFEKFCSWAPSPQNGYFDFFFVFFFGGGGGAFGFTEFI